MQAFHNDPAIKKKYIDRVKAHREADELIQGMTGQGGKGCAVWCTMNDYSHAAYETKIGVPEWLARLEDILFEGMSADDSMSWPEQFLETIPVGVDLESVKAPFLIFILDCALEKFDHEKYPETKKAVDDVIELYKSGENDLGKFIAAADAAAAYAPYAPAPAYAARAAYAAAHASYAARGGADAARAAAGADAYAPASAYAARAAKRKEYKRFADKLLELIREIK
jgi:hypothetical protein